MNSFVSRTVRVAGLLLVLAMALGSKSAFAATSADATIFNKATLTYSGGTVEAGISVKIALVEAAPVLSSPGDFGITTGETETVLYTITSGANGLDTYDLSAPSDDDPDGTLNAPVINFLEGATGSTALTGDQITLGGAITAATNTTANQILIPAGSEVNLVDGSYVSVAGLGVFKINGITPGTVASLANGDEVFTVVNLDTTTDLPADPRVTGADFGVGAVGPALLVGEEKQFRVEITAGSFIGGATAGDYNITVTADGGGGAGTDELVVTVGAVVVSFSKQVALVTGATAGVGGTVGTYSSAPSFEVQTDDVLEYRIVAQPAAGQPKIEDAVITDFVPDYTFYVEDSLYLNGVQVGCDSGCPLGSDNGTLPLASGTFQVNSQAGASDDGTGNDGVGKLGTIDAGNQATVTFRVIVE